MTIANQVLTYITKNNQLIPKEIKHSREETLNIMRHLVIEMENHDEETRVFENRYDEINRAECSIGLASSST